MDLALLVYGISLLNSFVTMFGAASMILCFLAMFCLVNIVTWSLDGDNSWNFDRDGNLLPRVVKWRNDIRKLFRWSLPLSILFLIVAVVLPSEKTAYTMIGAYAAQKVVENPQTQEMSSKVLKIINQKLDDFIEEGTKKAGKKAQEIEKNVKESVSQKVNEVIDQSDK